MRGRNRLGGDREALSQSYLRIRGHRSGHDCPIDNISLAGNFRTEQPY